MVSLTRFFVCALAVVGMTLGMGVDPVVAQTNSSVGFCMPISNNVDTSHGLIRMDTYYDNPTWYALEKASYDPVPYGGNYNICDDIGFSVGSRYYVRAQLYTVNENGTQVFLNDTHELVYFNVHIPRATVAWAQNGLDPGFINIYCSDDGC